MPERRIQRRVRRPPRRLPIHLPRAILELERRARRRQLGELRHVGVEGVGVVDVEGGGVDAVEAVAAVEVCEGRDGGPDPGGGEGGGGRLRGAVRGVEDGELVFVGVAEKDVCDDVRGVAVDDLVEEVGGIGEGVLWSVLGNLDIIQ